MSLNPQAPQKPHGLAVALLALPFIAIDAAGTRIASALRKKHPAKTGSLPAAPVEERLPDITANRQFLIADRLHRAEVNGRQVSFYQYHAARIIRISCRELRHAKPIDFTPAMAEKAHLVYDIDGAIQWVRANGLEANGGKRPASKVEAKSNNAPVNEQTPPWDTDNASKPKSKSQTASAEALDLVPATGNKSLPFTGHIVAFGITQISGKGKPFQSYAMTLRSETGSYEKQFIGEHLADLVAEMSLHEGQLIKIQLLGKHQFEVEVSGKTESRSRNFYQIQIL